DWKLLKTMLICGTISGREVDKFKEAKLTPEKAAKLLKAPKIKECLGAIECALIDKVPVGDHIMFLGEVVYAEAEEDFFQNGFWNTEKAELIYHIGGNRFMKSSPSEEVK
ncbi:MAG: flavin reductase family protein, partial [candidate division WOR-3 bacterium]